MWSVGDKFFFYKILHDFSHNNQNNTEFNIFLFIC